MLNVLSQFGIERRRPGAAMTVHLLIESMRRAFLDRAEFLGDPDFGPIPVQRLTSAEHARELAQSIDTTRATPSAALARDRIPVATAESDETTHFSVIDKDGNAVSNTYTLEQAFGSQVVVTGAGFLLNNEMGDFNKKPGVTNSLGDIGTQPNLIQPGKRMLSSMTPTIVARNGKVLLVTGSPGGRAIINTVLGLVLDVTAFGMDVRAAVDAPRLHHQWMPDETYVETAGLADSTVAALQAMGHTVKLGGKQGDGHSIYLDPATGTAFGANDKRSGDSKASAPQ
jgi:gamma-glutamyltranspeptidase/glutathione hydrolase